MYDHFTAPDEAIQSPYGTRNYGGEMTLTDLLFSFDGRISRSMFWGAYLCTTMVAAAVMIAAMMVSENLMLLSMVVILIPAAWIGLALEVKRWHDIGYSGWMILISLIPYLGGLIRLVMVGFFPSVEDNEYGPRPV